MQNPTFDEALAESLQLLEDGSTVDDCLTRFPEHAAELREAIAAAVAMRRRPPLSPAPAAASRSRAAVLSAAAQHAAAAENEMESLFVRGLRRVAVLPYALPAAIALLLLGSAAIGVSATSNNNPRGWFESSHSDQVKISGTITAIDSDSVDINTGTEVVTIAITPDTEFEGDGDATPVDPTAFIVGAHVKAHAFHAADGSLVAREIQIEDDGEANGDQTPAATNDDRNEVETPQATQVDDDHDDVDDVETPDADQNNQGENEHEGDNNQQGENEQDVGDDVVDDRGEDVGDDEDGDHEDIGDETDDGGEHEDADDNSGPGGAEDHGDDSGPEAGGGD